MIIADLIRRSLNQFASKTVISAGDRSLTYAELADRSHRLANALIARGITVGDRVATLGPNDLTSLELMVGLALGGYNRVAMHAMNSADAHREMLISAGARVLVIEQSFYEKIAMELAAVPSLEFVFVIGATDPSLLDYETVLAESDPSDSQVPIEPDTILHLAYSSGSSGTPRGSVHTHESWMAVTMDNACMLPRVTSDDIYLAAAPLTHAASTVLYLLLSRGASIEVMPHFDPTDALALIQNRGCTITFMVPTMLALLATHPLVGDYDLSSLRAVMYASAPISVATARAAQTAFGTVLFQSYGQSECLPATCLTPEDHLLGVTEDERILRSAGRACINASVKIVDENGQTLPTGQVGEILVSTQGRMRGIFNDPEATAERITDDGYVASNDVGYFDDRGLLFIVDRKNDMIISGGFNIWPAEIENALLKHAAVIDAAAVGVPHPRWGETPHAIVTLADGATVSADELVELCRTEIGSMKKPTEIIFATGKLPRNEFGKLSRRLIREQYWPETAVADRQVSGA